MVTKHEYHDLAWIDVENPSVDEVRSLMEEYSLDPNVCEEMLSPSIRSKIETGEDYIHLVLHFPALRHTNNSDGDQEIDFILGKNFIITTRYDTIDALHKFSKIFEVKAILGREEMAPDAGDIFLAMMTKLYRGIGHELEFIHDELEEAETQIFEGREKEMVVVLSNLSRDLLNIKQALNPHRDVLEALRTKAVDMFGEDYRRAHTNIIGEYHRINSLRSSNADSLLELRETNNSLLSTKQNETMKVLTIMTFITLPLSLVASIFGMNADAMPIVGQPFDFWIITGMMVLISLALFLYLTKKNWL